MKKKKTEVKICNLCKDFASMNELKKNACGCKKGVWRLHVRGFTKERYKKRLDKAKTCNLFKPAKN